MLIFSMGVSVDGYINDRNGEFNWSPPDEELFRFHLARVSGLGGYLMGRRLYEAMTVWETDRSLRDSPDRVAFADAWSALPKIVFSRSQLVLAGNARQATGSVADEIAAARDATDEDLEIGGATLAASAIEHDLVDELRVFRYPVVVGGGTPFLPPVERDLPLRLLESRTFESGVVYERFQRDRT